jgi:hypothetical protein
MYSFLVVITTFGLYPAILFPLNYGCFPFSFVLGLISYGDRFSDRFIFPSSVLSIDGASIDSVFRIINRFVSLYSSMYVIPIYFRGGDQLLSFGWILYLVLYRCVVLLLYTCIVYVM